MKIDKHQPIDVYGRALGVLFRDSDNLNVNLEMLKRCAADVTTKYPRHKYISQKEYAQAARSDLLPFRTSGSSSYTAILLMLRSELMARISSR